MLTGRYTIYAIEDCYIWKSDETVGYIPAGRIATVELEDFEILREDRLDVNYRILGYSKYQKSEIELSLFDINQDVLSIVKGLLQLTSYYGSENKTKQEEIASLITNLNQNTIAVKNVLLEVKAELVKLNSNYPKVTG